MSGWPSLDRADDERLARSLAAGDPSALIQVMDRYAARLYDYCHALLRDQDLAAGALHDALIAAYAHVSVLREPDRFRGWLYALVRNECMRRLRDPDRPAERHEAPEVEDGFLDEAEQARRQEARRLVHGALAGLRGREREALDLMLRHGLDAGEVGGVLGMDAQEATDLTGEAHARLDDALAAGYLARAGRDDCPEIAAIAGDGTGPLPPPVLRRLVHHIQTCGICGPRRDRTVSAARLLQVLPVAMMPTDLRGLVMATATDPALAADLAAIAHGAEPFDAWGWPHGLDRADARDSSGRRPPRGLLAALAAAAAVIVIVAGAFYVMSGSPGEPTAAKGPSGGAPGSAASPSSPGDSESPSDSPSPTESETPTPTPTTTSPTPTPTRTRTPTRTSRPSATSSAPRTGRLSVGGCTISGPGRGSCNLPVRAVGGTVTWSVTGTSGGLSAGGGGTLRNGQSTSVRVSGTCTPPGGSGTVSFSPGGTGSVTLSCDEEPPGDGPGGD
ncbi:sigma-70 family RNA polymerase sigma factor [Actinomadura madurae]|uniref:RNA polymerase sigma factor n=1 Tax=Actinomadura madurae TaxID=1993 RepID=UPI002025C4BB|nr:sigma-70 family RNA polymerase sigma factor [Actinomadura madurae]URM95498.1 sigma-70 family RNA polymerase sigma factor [Actinomadura madurae]